MRIIKLLFPMALLLSLPAFADAGPPDAGQDGCHSDEQCIVVEEACPNGWRAINRDYELRHKQWLDQTRPLIQCSEELIPGLPVPTKAVCADRKCVVELPKPSQNKEVTLQEIRYCLRDSDCSIAEGICSSTWVAINSEMTAPHKDWLQKMRPIVDCMPGDELARPPQTAYCHANQCTVY